MTSAWHRLAAWLAGCTAAVGLTAGALVTAAPAGRLLTAGLAVPVLATAAFVGARVLPRHRPMPYWGRLADLSQSAATVAQIPVLLAVLGTYDAVRGLGG